MTQGSKLVKSSYVTCESEAKILDIVGELKAVERRDDEDGPSEEEKAASIGGDDGPREQSPKYST